VPEKGIEDFQKDTVAGVLVVALIVAGVLLAVDNPYHTPSTKHQKKLGPCKAFDQGDGGMEKAKLQKPVSFSIFLQRGSVTTMARQLRTGTTSAALDNEEDEKQKEEKETTSKTIGKSTSNIHQANMSSKRIQSANQGRAARAFRNQPRTYGYMFWGLKVGWLPSVSQSPGKAGKFSNNTSFRLSCRRLSTRLDLAPGPSRKKVFFRGCSRYFRRCETLVNQPILSHQYKHLYRSRLIAGGARRGVGYGCGLG